MTCHLPHVLPSSWACLWAADSTPSRPLCCCQGCCYPNCTPWRHSGLSVSFPLWKAAVFSSQRNRGVLSFSGSTHLCMPSAVTVGHAGWVLPPVRSPQDVPCSPSPQMGTCGSVPARAVGPALCHSGRRPPLTETLGSRSRLQPGAGFSPALLFGVWLFPPGHPACLPATKSLARHQGPAVTCGRCTHRL